MEKEYILHKECISLQQFAGVNLDNNARKTVVDPNTLVVNAILSRRLLFNVFHNLLIDSLGIAWKLLVVHRIGRGNIGTRLIVILGNSCGLQAGRIDVMSKEMVIVFIRFYLLVRNASRNETTDI